MSSENVEAMVIRWLRDLVPEYKASSDTPKTLPKKFILVERTGGAREAIIGDNAEILIEVYDKDSRADCSEIAGFIADHLFQLMEDYENITHATVNSVISLDDTQKQCHRYQIYCDIFHSRAATFAPAPPMTTSLKLTNSTGREITSVQITRVGGSASCHIHRTPTGSHSPITCTLSEQADKFSVVLLQQPSPGVSYGSVTITQDVATNPRRTITATFTCGTATAVLEISPR